jgi:hypothetical protein
MIMSALIDEETRLTWLDDQPVSPFPKPHSIVMALAANFTIAFAYTMTSSSIG